MFFNLEGYSSSKTNQAFYIKKYLLHRMVSPIESLLGLNGGHEVICARLGPELMCSRLNRTACLQWNDFGVVLQRWDCFLWRGKKWIPRLVTAVFCCYQPQSVCSVDFVSFYFLS